MENNQELLEEELDTTENEIHYLSEERKILAFRIPDNVERIEENMDDDFFQLSLNEMKMIYQQLQESRKELEEAPLLTKKKREELDKEKTVIYKESLVRVEFPDRTVLQGVFSPEDRIADLAQVVSEYIAHPTQVTFFTAPPKVVLEPKWSLREAGLVPTGKVYFKGGEDSTDVYLRDGIIFSSHQAANQAAALIRSSYREDNVKSKEVENGVTPQQSGAERRNTTEQRAASLLKFLSKPSASSNIRTS